MAKGAKKLAISMPDPLYQSVERARRVSGKTRSAVIHEALRYWLEQQAEAGLVRAYVGGYRGRPEGLREVRAAEAAAVRLLSAEDWSMRRGENWWAELPAPAGRRLVILLSRNEAYAVRELVTVAPVTTRVRGIPTEVALGPEQELPKPCVANLDTITTTPRRSLSAPIGPLSPDKLHAVERALLFALGFPAAVL